MQDRSDLTPFTIALVRGHSGLAELILDIADAQYLPKSETTKRKRYEIVIDADSDTDSDSDGEPNSDQSDHDHGIGVRVDLVDEQHTIDDIRDLASMVKSTISPTSLLYKKSNLSSFLGEAEPKFKEAFQQGISSYNNSSTQLLGARNYGTPKKDPSFWRVSSCLERVPQFKVLGSAYSLHI